MDRVSSLMMSRDRKDTAQALIRERAAEARHLAGCLRTSQPEDAALAAWMEKEIASKLDARAAKLDEIADQWGRS
jgi:hypothetical protein